MACRKRGRLGMDTVMYKKRVESTSSNISEKISTGKCRKKNEDSPKGLSYKPICIIDGLGKYS